MPLPRRAPIGAGKRPIRLPQRRFASHDSHGQHSSGNQNAALGGMFYTALAIPPVMYALWRLSRTENGEEPALTKFLRSFDSWQDAYRERGELHARLVQQAADDKILFASEGVSTAERKVPLNNIESISMYSPQCNQPGWSSINLSKLIDHLKEQDDEMEAKNKERKAKRDAAGYYER